MGGGLKDWAGIVTVSGGFRDAALVSCAVDADRARLDTGLIADFLGMCTGLSSRASSSGVFSSLTVSVSKSPARY